MTWVVHHYFPIGSSNVGDALVAHALRQALSLQFGPLEFRAFPANERAKDPSREIGLRGTNLERSNAEADLVLIGGSNLLEPRKVSRAHSERTPWHWGVCTDLDSIHRLRVPLMLCGMGTGSDWGQKVRSYTPRAAEEVKLLHQKAFVTAVRDEMTVTKLAEIGVKTQCIGCPVTFLTKRQITISGKHLPLIVSLPPARILRTWSGRWFMRQTMNYLQWLQQQPISFVVTLHERADREFAPNWLPRGITPFYTEDVSELISRYEDSCGVIGFRLHAALLGLGVGKPIIPVNVDWRGRGFVHTFGLQDIALEPFSWGGMRRLRQLTLNLVQGDPALLSRLDFQKQRFQKRFDAFLSQAANAYHLLQPRKRLAAS
jgi:hypothetical protein